MKNLPDGRDKVAEERAYLDECYRTKRKRSEVEAFLHKENFFDASKRPNRDVWVEIYKVGWDGAYGEITGAGIMSALRDHLSTLQAETCCYCRQPLLKGGYARPIEHILPRARYGQFSFHFWNLAVACERCNRLKKDDAYQAIPENLADYPELGEFCDYYHPRLHPYEAHVDFVLRGSASGHFVAYVGLSAQGKKLVADILSDASQEMNREFSDPAIKDALETLRTKIATQSEEAIQIVRQFDQALRDAMAEA